MKRLFLFFALLVAAGAGPARAADGIPARPKPFTFVTDQAGLLQPADLKRLDGGLRTYADNTGTQVVVVTVPSLGGRDVNAEARQIGTSWGLGQKDKNNGLVVLIASQEHKLSIAPGSGLRSTITPAVIQRVISEMTPQFKQSDYAGGLRKGLNTLLVTANPSSAPKTAAAATAATAETPATSGSVASGASLGANTPPAAAQAMEDPAGATQSTETTPTSSGLPWGTLLLGAVVVIGGILLLKKLFGGRSNAASNGPTGGPNFYPNQQPNNQPAPNQPNFYPNQQQPGGNYGAPQSSGSGMGGILATGAAAAAGAYLGNRLGGSHEENTGGSHNFSNENNANAGNSAGSGAAAGAGGAAGGDYFASRGNQEADTNSAPDYFADNNSSAGSGDYFSGNDNSYDNSSGGGGFDDTNTDNSGSW